ncbi:lipopolysaccharide assembly protein LapA domain-containing protein [Rhodosalinus sp.]|uniref:lipopolysaccharide assembly protein LapA domain-containing protein n=1 Tax=Rhodosalinus sp. TaxID=2047741 RepID=UPI00356812B7
MRYLRYAILAVIAIVLVSVALANRAVVTLALLPEALEDLAGWNVSAELPLFLVILGGVAAGLLIGFVWEWIREHKHRAEKARQQAEAKRLQRELRRAKVKGEEADEVLALVDKRAG